MDFFDSYHWGTTKKLCSIVGTWPFQPGYQRKICRFLVFSIVQSIYIVEIFRLIEVRGQLAETLDCFPVFIYHSVVQIKITNSYVNINKVKNLLLRVKSDWTSNLENSEIELLKSENHLYKMIMDIYIMGCFSISIIYICEPMAPMILDVIMPLNETRPRVLPFPTQYFINPKIHFNKLYAHQFLVNWTAITAFFAFDALYIAFVQHACTMFTIIGNRLKNLTADNDQNESGINSLVICIKMHKDLLQFTTLLEEHYTNYFFFMLGVMVLMLSATGFQFVVMENDAFEKIRIVWYGTGQITHLFFLSYFGEKLIEHSATVNESMCAAKWYSFPQKMKMLFMIMMIRSKSVSSLTAGKIYVMSVANFGAIMKSSFSYFTVLTSAQ